MPWELPRGMKRYMAPTRFMFSISVGAVAHGLQVMCSPRPWPLVVRLNGRATEMVPQKWGPQGLENINGLCEVGDRDERQTRLCIPASVETWELVVNTRT